MDQWHWQHLRACQTCRMASHTPGLLNCNLHFNKIPKWLVCMESMRSTDISQGLVTSFSLHLLKMASWGLEPIPSGYTHLPDTYLLWDNGVVSHSVTTTSSIGAFLLIDLEEMLFPFHFLQEKSVLFQLSFISKTQKLKYLLNYLFTSEQTIQNVLYASSKVLSYLLFPLVLTTGLWCSSHKNTQNIDYYSHLWDYKAEVWMLVKATCVKPHSK